MASLRFGGDDSVASVPEAFAWLNAEDVLRGRVRIERKPGGPEDMGSWPDVIQVALAPGGAAVTLAGAIVYWLRNRTSTIRVSMRRADGAEVTVAAQRVRQLDGDQLSTLTNDLAGWLDSKQDGTPPQLTDDGQEP